MRLGPESATIEVLTFREGVLSAVGHDLLLRAERFEVEVDAGRVRAHVDPRGLRVVGAWREGRVLEGVLGPHEVADIERHLQREVLESGRHPDILFESLVLGPGVVEGRLTLHGQTRPLRIPFHTEEGVHQAELTLDQRDFGIRPYRAMLGSLKVKPQVRVRLRLPASGP